MATIKRTKQPISITNPDLSKEWDYVNNMDLTPDVVFSGSHKKVWWIDKYGHSWQSTVSDRASGSGCPICSGKQVLPGFNDLATINPLISEEWDYEKNKPLTPKDVTAGSGKKVWWKCPLGHSYDDTINHRASGRKCSICSGRRIVSGINDLQTTNPELAVEWDYEKNYPLMVEQCSKGSQKKVWWKCKFGHTWQATPANRSKGKGCPVCSGRQVLSGYNDLETWCKQHNYLYLLDEWDYEKNVLLPSQVSPYKNAKVFWKCRYGHEWFSRINSRIQGVGCPVCAKELKTSFPEQALFFYIKKICHDAVNGDIDSIGMELDIYIPSMRIAVEYDGVAWHKENEKEIRKNNLCKQNAIKLIRVRESGLPDIGDCYCVFRNDNTKDISLEESIKEVLSLIDPLNRIDVDIRRDRSVIFSCYIQGKKENSLAALYPEISKEWHPTRNGQLTPEMVSFKSNKLIWWKCSVCKYEWEAQVSSRISPHGCPVCNRKKALSNRSKNNLKKKGALAVLYPEIAAQWDYERNGSITPNDITAGSNEKFGWICSLGHKWDAIVANRTSGKGCPTCKRIKLSEQQKRPVICIETNELFESASTAEEKLGINRISISNCCRGKQKTAGGYHWKFSC